MTVGKIAKSSGRTMYDATIITIKAMAMLKVKSKSSANGGSGSTIIESTMMMNSGAMKALSAVALPPINFWSCCIKGFIRQSPGQT